MPQPPLVQASADPLVQVYRSAWERIQAKQQAIVDNPDAYRARRRLAALEREIGSILSEVDKDAAAWISERLPATYESGALAAGNVGDKFSWSNQFHRQAIEVLANDTYSDLLSASRFTRRSTKTMIRQLAKEGVISAMTGDTAKQGGRSLAGWMKENGIFSVRYKDGTRQGIAAYAEMVVRTKSAVTYNSGTINQGTVNGVEFYEVFDGAGCGWLGHGDVDQANGSIRSAKECAQVAISHPNCARSFGPRPDITDKKDAVRDNAFGRQHTEADIEAERERVATQTKTRRQRNATRERVAARKAKQAERKALRAAKA